MPSSLLGQDRAAPTVAFGQAHRQVQFTALLQGGFQHWDNGYLITYAWDTAKYASPERPAVVLYDKDGRVAREAVIWFEGADLVTVSGVAVGRSGQLVAAGGISNSQGVVANYIAEIGPDNRVRRVIRTTPFAPFYVCAMEDGTVWTYGLERDSHLNGIQSSFRLRQYSFEKGQIRALLDTSGLNSGWELERGRYPGEISLRCNSKTLVLYNGQSADPVELDLHSNAVKVTKIPALPSAQEFRITGFALTESGDIFASFKDLSAKSASSGLFRINRGNAGDAKWAALDGTVGPYLHGSPIERLLGTDGDDIVHTRLKDGNSVLVKTRQSIALQFGENERFSKDPKEVTTMKAKVRAAWSLAQVEGSLSRHSSGLGNGITRA
jgi:hypothetical protein